MKIRELFVNDVERDIPPVVYFHEQSPEKLDAEVSEYIITGGWPDDHPNHRRVPNGIHEQYVRLLKGIASELKKPNGTDLPNCWISGFYGSGKSSFAKLLGMSLDGVALPNGSSLSDAWLKRNTSPRTQEMRLAWDSLIQQVDPISVVFDIGSIARDNEHIHSAAVRQIQRRLGYCSTDAIVANFELDLERDGEWTKFESKAEEVLGKPWSSVRDNALAEEDFSLVLHKLYPEKYVDPMNWYDSRAGTKTLAGSPDEAVQSIRDMIQFRKPGSTLFLVVDEVSQFVLSSPDRVDRFRAFATALGATLKGKAWLLALGQQKLDEEADGSFLDWAKARFPQKLRVHLAPTNIRDVVHKRLLQKKKEHEDLIRSQFSDNRPDLKLYAYGCEDVTADEFVEVYPMLPGQIDLILQITTALRSRSTRAQGDDQAIRGLLQLLGELFRDQKLAEMELGALVTLDQIYEVQQSALDADVQNSMAKILNQCSADSDALLVRAAKAVSLLELIQETSPTDAKLVAQCLYDRVDLGNQLDAVTAALEELRNRNLLGYSEKQGYKIQSSAGEEWERERRDIGISREKISDIVQDALKYLMSEPERPQHKSRPFPWAALFSDGRSCNDERILDPRDDAVVRVDFRFLTNQDDRSESSWITRSDETALRERLVWVCGDTNTLDQVVRELARSSEIIRKNKPRRESLSQAKKSLLNQEETRAEELLGKVRDEVASAWMNGQLFFQGKSIATSDHGSTFRQAVVSVANRFLPDLYPHFIATTIGPAELMQLLELELSGPSPKFLNDDLGILELDGGRYVPGCAGVVPQRIQSHIENEGGVSGSALISHFGGPPYAYSPDITKACVAGLLRAAKIRLQPDEGNEITAVRDAGVRDVFEKDRSFRRSDMFPAGDDGIGPQTRARICKFFEDELKHSMDREDTAIADAVQSLLPQQNEKLREVLSLLNQLPGKPDTPPELEKLSKAIEDCLRHVRQTQPTVKQVQRHLDSLRDGVRTLAMFHSELSPEAIQAVRAAADLSNNQIAQLSETKEFSTELQESAKQIENHLADSRPWRDITTLDEDIEKIRTAYVAERGRLLAWQESQAEQARSRIKLRDGYSTLTADDQHSVTRSITAAIIDTDAEAVAPALSQLGDPFLLSLGRAEDEANHKLDELLSSGDKPLIVTVDLGIRNRELSSEADVDALLSEIRKRLIEQVEAGTKVRLI